MTIIAWDGKTLAADKAGTVCGYRRTVTKIYRVPQGLVGFAGNGPRALAVLQWFKDGCVQAEWPKTQADEDNAQVLFVDLQGKQWAYSSTPFPELCEDAFNAIGAGRDYALAAMYLGHDARRAVEVACALDNSCGNGIDTLTLDGETQ